jgi:hypothetical protein
MMGIEDTLLLSLASARRRRLLTGEPASCQEHLLTVLVRRGEPTVFGRRHGFSTIRSLAEYLDRVPPQSYASLKEHLEAVEAGSSGELCPGRPVCFGLTSGTSGAPKLIPLDRAALRSSRLSALDAALLGGLQHGGLAWHRARTLYIGPRKARRLGDWDVYAEGTAAAYLQPALLRARFVPKYADLPEDHEPQNAELLLELSRKHSVACVAGNPVEIAAFATATGLRMEEVQIVFNCGFFATDNLRTYRCAFPNATVVDVYGANEAVYGLPSSTGDFLLNYRRLVYSFLELSGDEPPVALPDAEVGRKYVLCVTTPGGLWNYVTDDVVRVISRRPPLIRLCGRANRVLSVGGEQVTEDEVIAAVRTAGVRTDRYLLAAGDRRYVLYMDGEDADVAAVDRELGRQNSGYADARRLGKLLPLVVCRRSMPGTERAKPVRIATSSAELEGLLGADRAT